MGADPERQAVKWSMCVLHHQTRPAGSTLSGRRPAEPSLCTYLGSALSACPPCCLLGAGASAARRRVILDWRSPRDLRHLECLSTYFICL